MSSQQSTYTDNKVFGADEKDPVLIPRTSSRVDSSICESSLSILQHPTPQSNVLDETYAKFTPGGTQQIQLKNSQSLLWRCLWPIPIQLWRWLGFTNVTHHHMWQLLVNEGQPISLPRSYFNGVDGEVSSAGAVILSLVPMQLWCILWY